MTSPSGEPRRLLGEVLVEQGLLSTPQLEDALAEQVSGLAQGNRRRLGEVVVALGFASEAEVARALGEALGLRVLDLRRTAIDRALVRLLPRAMALRNGLLVVGREGQRLVVASADPTNVVAIDDVKIYTRAPDVEVVVSTASQVRDQLDRAWSMSEDATEGLVAEEEQSPEDLIDQDEVNAAPVVRLVDGLLADAVRARASDIHVEPQPDELRIRFRIDGLLRDVMSVPKSATSAVVSRLKIVSGLDIAERRRPQDGRAKIVAEGSVIEARVSTLPTLIGEKVVLRLLPSSDRVPQMSRTGLSAQQLEVVSSAFTQSQGLILITGPTGSGKTSTLYAALNQVSTPDRNILTLEDPVEIQITGITQVQVHERAGMTFTRGLRSALRQDPDIILVGEVRDAETADLALRASLTGHLVLTTLHTNDAVSAVTRLVDMGVEPYLVASSLALVVAQRLLRKVCSSCAAPYAPSGRTLSLLGLREADLDGASPRRGSGCLECGGTGYLGRTGVFEVLPVTAALRKVLLDSPTEAAIGAAARENGMETLRSQALRKAHDGETTYEEVLRSTHLDTGTAPRCRTCARTLADDMLCCPWDGTLVAESTCSGCGRVVDPEWAHCPWCRTALGGSGIEPAPAGKGLPQLLVVDDDDNIRGFVAMALTGVADVTGAATAAQALELVGERHFDGALVDQGLPDVSGVELIRLLRSDPRTLALPLMMFSGTASTEVAREARHAGAMDFLPKPLDPLLLEERVLTLVGQSAVEGS